MQLQMLDQMKVLPAWWPQQKLNRMSCGGTTSRALLPYLAVLGIIWIGWFVFHPSTTVLSTANNKQNTPKPSHSSFTDTISDAIHFDTRGSFIRAAEATTITGDFDPTTLQRVCASKSFPSDLVMKCEGILGGIGNVRQEVLTCMRWAVEIGAHAIIPQIQPRVDSNSTNGEETKNEYTPAEKGISRLLDQDVFLQRMGEACPQMKFYEDIDSIKKLMGTPVQGIGFLKIGRLNSSQKFIHDTAGPWISQRRAPWGSVSVMALSRSLGDYEICDDGEEFANNFGKIAVMPPNIRRLAAVVLYELSKKFNLNLDPRKPIHKDSYIGIHLRTAMDAQKAGWMTIAQQSEAYLKYLSRYKTPVIYIATGNLSSVAQFGQLVAPTPVVQKFDLVSGEDARELLALTWDQQAEIDYIVLSRASQFLGMVDSSFSWGVAESRHPLSGERTCGAKRGKGNFRRDSTLATLEVDSRGVMKRVHRREGPAVGLGMDDGLSIIIGTRSAWHFREGTWWP